MGMMPSKTAFKESVDFVGKLSLLVLAAAAAYWVGDHYLGKVGILIAAVLCIICGVAGVIQVKNDIDARFTADFYPSDEPPND